jgi:hypothetical protein
MNKDTINLRKKETFEIEVSPNIFWIPVNSLGHTRYTDEEIKSILVLSPNEKRQKINNLYEAIQLFQASKFKGIGKKFFLRDTLCFDFFCRPHIRRKIIADVFQIYINLLSAGSLAAVFFRCL